MRNWTLKDVSRSPAPERFSATLAQTSEVLCEEDMGRGIFVLGKKPKADLDTTETKEARNFFFFGSQAATAIQTAISGLH